MHTFFLFIKSTPPVGLEPTTARLRAARSTDWARKATDILYFILFLSSVICNYMTLSSILICHHLSVDIILCLRMSSVVILCHPMSSIITLIPLILLYLFNTRLSFLYSCTYLFSLSVFRIPMPLFLYLRSPVFLYVFPFCSLESFRGSVGRANGC